MKNKIKIGIDLGGTKIEIIAINGANEVVHKKRIASPRHNYIKTIKVITDLVLTIEKQLNNLCTVGLAIPGSISPFSGKVRNGNSTWLNGKNLQNDINKSLGREVKISNDANCFAISEAIDGSAYKFNSVFGVILGTGVGGGLVINKKLINGHNGISGEWGHNEMPWNNRNELEKRICWCGLENCIETFISGPSLEKEYFNNFNEKLPLEEISKKDINGDKNSNYIINNLVERSAKALAFIINVYDPEAIVLGGGLSNINRLYSDIPNIWNNWIFSDECKTKLLKPKFGDSSGVRGAAWLHD
tara:strand:+ start:123 stop:1028 length:906 start_codon:yes stop_codon:yes gene_type:complete